MIKPLFVLGGMVAGLVALSKFRDQNGDLGRPPKLWWEREMPRSKKACYRTKSDTLKVFLEANRDVVENYGGETMRVSPSEFDAVNHKYNEKARTIVDAIWAALPKKDRPYCFDDIDLDALNDTSPAREAEKELGRKFRLPEFLFEKKPIFPTEIEPPPDDWRDQCRAWADAEKYERERIVEKGRGDCFINSKGKRQCSCRNADGMFEPCEDLPEAPF